VAPADDEEVSRQRRIAEACLGQGEVAVGRLGLYRRLVQGNLSLVARRLLPRTADALDGVVEGGFRAWFAKFLAERGPRTPYLRDVPIELVEWATPLWRADAAVPRFVPDLARYELDRFDVDRANADASSPQVTEVSLDRPLVFARPIRLARYDYAVHEAVPPPANRETWLLLHRDDESSVVTTAIDPRAAPFIEAALAGAPLGEALARTTENEGALGGQSARLEVARWLAELGASGALLGGQG